MEINAESVQQSTDSLEKIEKRKDKIKNWLKNPLNLIFILILIFAIAIRLYYFNLTKNQALWWDESDYLAYAKNLAGFPVNWTITAQHASTYPFIIALFFKLGLGEIISKFFVQLIPSVLTVVLAYLICNEMYEDKRIGLIASFLMAAFWLHLFNTIRFHIDIPALFAGFLAMYVFWLGYENKKKIFGKIDPKWAIPITVFFTILTYTIRRGYFLFGVFFLIYMITTQKWKYLIKDKYNWIALVLGLILIFSSENFIFASSGISQVGGSYYHEEYSINFLPLTVFKDFFVYSSEIWKNALFYLFWVGILILILNAIISFGYIKKMKTNTRADIFNIITIIITLAFFIFVLRTPDGIGESRWYFPLLLGAFVCISRASLIIVDYIKKYNKHLTIGILILIIVFGGYYQIKQADGIIKEKINSFEGIRQASIYIKENSNENDIIVSVAVPQVIYYAERNVVQPDKIAEWTGAGEQLPFENFMQALKNFPNAKYFLVSFSQTGNPDWMTRVYGNNGQVTVWEIPFMDTKIDFANQQQEIKRDKTYDTITFTLLDIKQDVFIYEIKRK